MWITMLCVLSGCPVHQAWDKVPHSHTREKNQVTGEAYYLYVPSSYDEQKKRIKDFCAKRDAMHQGIARANAIRFCIPPEVSDG